jgi:hypothetical protein
VSAQRRSTSSTSSTRQRCAACGGILRPTHRFCPNCGTPVGGSAPTPSAGTPVRGPSLQVSSEPTVDLSENRRLVTVLFADISGSTPLGERLDAEDLRRVLTSFFGALAREIQRYGGTVDKYIGDAVMAVFGAPVAHEDDAERAISAAIAMQASIGQLNEDLQRRHGQRLALRIGINTGEVVAGLLSGESAGLTPWSATRSTPRSASSPSRRRQHPGRGRRLDARRAFDFETPPPAAQGQGRAAGGLRVLGPLRGRRSLGDAAGRSGQRAGHAARALEARPIRGRGNMVTWSATPHWQSRLVRELRAAS